MDKRFTEFLNENLIGKYENLKEYLYSYCLHTEFECYTDNAKNIIIHKNGTGKKIHIPILISETKVIIKSISDKNIAEFDTINYVQKSALTDREVFYGDSSAGIIRSKNTPDEKDSQIIELWDGKSVEAGDICTFKHDVSYKANKLYGFELASIIPLKTVLASIKLLSDAVNDIYFTVSFCENALKSVAGQLSADKILIICCAKAEKSFESSNGCGIVYKDGGAVIDSNVRNFIKETAEKYGIHCQPYFGKISHLTEELGLLGSGAEIGAVCIPVKHLGSRTEIIDISDIYGASDLGAKLLSDEKI